MSAHRWRSPAVRRRPAHRLPESSAHLRPADRAARDALRSGSSRSMNGSQPTAGCCAPDPHWARRCGRPCGRNPRGRGGVPAQLPLPGTRARNRYAGAAHRLRPDPLSSESNADETGPARGIPPWSTPTVPAAPIHTRWPTRCGVALMSAQLNGGWRRPGTSAVLTRFAWSGRCRRHGGCRRWPASIMLLASTWRHLDRRVSHYAGESTNAFTTQAVGVRAARADAGHHTGWLKAGRFCISTGAATESARLFEPTPARLAAADRCASPTPTCSAASSPPTSRPYSTAPAASRWTPGPRRLHRPGRHRCSGPATTGHPSRSPADICVIARTWPTRSKRSPQKGHDDAVRADDWRRWRSARMCGGRRPGIRTVLIPPMAGVLPLGSASGSTPPQCANNRWRSRPAAPQRLASVVNPRTSRLRRVAGRGRPG